MIETSAGVSGPASVVADEGGSDTRRRRLLGLLPVGLVVLAAVLPALRFFDIPPPSQDEWILLVYADQILDGRLPHRDFFTVYGPGTFALVGAAFRTLGASVEAERAVGLGYHIALAVGVMQLTRRYGRAPSVAVGMACAVILLPLQLIAYAWLGALAAVIWALVLLDRGSSRRLVVLAGVLAGAAGFWRPEMIVVSVLASCPFIIRTRRWRPFVAGLTLGLTPTIAYGFVVGPQLVKNIVLDRLTVRAGLDVSRTPLALWALVAIVGTCCAVLVVAAVRARSRASISDAVLALLLMAQTLQRLDLDHLSFSACVVVPLVLAKVCAFVPVSAPSREGSLFSRLTPPFIAVAAVLFLANGVDAVIRHQQHPPVHVAVGDRSLIVADAAAASELESTLAQISRVSPPGSSVFLGDKDMSRPTVSWILLYHLLPDLRSDAYYLELPPGVAEKRGSPLVADITGADVLVLADVPAARTALLFPYLGLGSEDANQTVASEFCAVAETAYGTVYTHCAPTQLDRTPRSRR